MKKLFLILCICCCIGGCSTDKQLPAKENRIAVSNQLTPSMRHKTTKKPIQLSNPEIVSLWSQSGATGQNLTPYLKVSNSIKYQWDRDIGDGLSNDSWTMAEPIIANGIIYALDADFNLSAVQLSDGKRLWETTLPLFNPTSEKTIGLAYSYEKLFSVSGNGTVVCTDLTGTVIWKKELNESVRSVPKIYRNRIYLLTADNQLILLNTKNGSEVWRYRGMPVQTNLLGMGTPAMYKNMAIVPFSNGEVIALDVNTHQVLWSKYLSAPRTFNRIADLTHILASPVIDNQIVYLIGNANKMGAFHLKTGEEIWSLPMGGNNTPAISGNTLYMINNQNILVALNKQNGQLFWDKPLNKSLAEQAQWHGPLLAGDNAVVVSDEGDILFVDLKTGKINQTSHSDGFTLPPIGCDETLIFLTNDAELIAYK